MTLKRRALYVVIIIFLSCSFDNSKDKIEIDIIDLSNDMGKNTVDIDLRSSKSNFNKNVYKSFDICVTVSNFTDSSIDFFISPLLSSDFLDCFLNDSEISISRIYLFHPPPLKDYYFKDGIIILEPNTAVKITYDIALRKKIRPSIIGNNINGPMLLFLHDYSFIRIRDYEQIVVNCHYQLPEEMEERLQDRGYNNLFTDELMSNDVILQFK